MPVTIKYFLWVFPVCLTLVFLLFTIDDNVSKLPFVGRNSKTSGLANQIMVIDSNMRYSQLLNYTYKILYWTGSSRGPRSPRNWFGLGTKPFDKCAYKNCILTGNRSEYNSSDGVLLYMRYAKPLPKYKYPWQKWIMRIHESPANEKDYTEYNNVFNATWTYHTKSDIYSHIYYRKFLKLKTPGKAADNKLSQRNRTIAWFVSRCYVQSQRDILVKGLQKYIEVDIYGICGTMQCGERMDRDCDEMLSNKYKFYLSFENSLCQEYVTEKLWRAYSRNVVPIVMGASKYSSYLPEHSYIDIARFASIKELADYIKILDKNETLYMEYFEWKKYYKIGGYEGGDVCPLCEFMNTHWNTTKIYDRLDLFWNTERDCYPPTVYYKQLFDSIK